MRKRLHKYFYLFLIWQIKKAVIQSDDHPLKNLKPKIYFLQKMACR